MTLHLLPALAVGALLAGSLPASAQEKAPPPEKTEKLPAPKKEQVLPAPAPLAVLAPGCEAACPVPKVLWVEQQVPVQILVPRAVITEVRQPSLAIVYRDEKRVFTNIVMKPRDVVRAVPCTTMVPCTVTDPCTGHCTTTMQPVVEMKLQKDVEFYAVPEEQVEIVKVPYLKQVEEIVPRKSILLEYRTDMQTRGYAVAVPGLAVPPDQWLIAPNPCPSAMLPGVEAGPPVERPVLPPPSPEGKR